MSRLIQEWLLSKNNYVKNKVRSSKVISITSGKGGVGKTSISIKLSKVLAQRNKKVLLIDCDYNLSNTYIKLGIPVNNDFYSLISAKKDFKSVLFRDGYFHLLGACNGDISMFEGDNDISSFIKDIIEEHRKSYDYVILDCPAGISKETLDLNAFSDHRVVVANPDKSSITDAYSLIKILKLKYNICDNHLLVNKVSSMKQYHYVIKTLGETVENFLSGRLHILGKIIRARVNHDKFDQLLLNDQKNEILDDFVALAKKIEDMDLKTSSHEESKVLIEMNQIDRRRQEVVFER